MQEDRRIGSAKSLPAQPWIPRSPGFARAASITPTAPIVWNVRRRWPELKPRLQHALLHGQYPFSPLRQIQIDG
jgi:hypothetical protein